MIKNRNILEWLQRVLRKEVRGNVLSMRDFNTYLSFAQRKRFDWLVSQMELTSRVTKSLEVYQDTETLTGLTDEGLYGAKAIPVDTEKVLRAMVLYGESYVKADMVTQLELERRLDDSLTVPTQKHPVYVLQGGEAHVYPYAAGMVVSITYIKTPEKAYLDWVVKPGRTVRYLEEGAIVTLSEGETYPNGEDGGTSLTEEMYWSQEDTVAVADMLLRNISPTLADQGAYQFSSEESAKSERL